MPDNRRSDAPRARISVSSADRRSTTMRAVSSRTTRAATVRLAYSSHSSTSADCAAVMNGASWLTRPVEAVSTAETGPRSPGSASSWLLRPVSASLSGCAWPPVTWFSASGNIHCTLIPAAPKSACTASLAPGMTRTPPTQYGGPTRGYWRLGNTAAGSEVQKAESGSWAATIPLTLKVIVDGCPVCTRSGPAVCIIDPALSPNRAAVCWVTSTWISG